MQKKKNIAEAQLEKERIDSLAEVARRTVAGTPVNDLIDRSNSNPAYRKERK